MKPTVYIETSIVSYLTARPGNDIRAMANRNTTVEWWEDRRIEFEIYISEFVLQESAGGDSEAASRRLVALDGLPELDVTQNVRDLAKWLIDEGSIPAHAERWMPSMWPWRQSTD